jgi:hypothetical protein
VFNWLRGLLRVEHVTIQYHIDLTDLEKAKPFLEEYYKMVYGIRDGILEVDKMMDEKMKQPTDTLEESGIA